MKQERKITARARDLRAHSTDAEECLWQQLRNGQIGGHRFRRQHPIAPYFADFACITQHLIIELDGGQHADNRNDSIRTAHLEKLGWRVLRFWNNEVLENMPSVLLVIGEALDRK